VEVLRGRGIEPSDVRGAPFVALVDELAARTYWPGEDPIGKRIRYHGADSAWITIVGVVESIRFVSPEQDPRPTVYVPHAQTPRESGYPGHAMTMVIRGGRRPAALIAPVREIVARLDPAVPVTRAATMEEVVAQAMGRPRLATGLMSLFALAALLLGALGIYGVVSYAVQERTAEIGIRMALGAEAKHVRRMVLCQGLKLVAAGILTGTVAALAAGRLLSGLLFGVRATDPATLVTVIGLLAGIALLASYLPARKATSVDPIRALRGGGD